MKTKLAVTILLMSTIWLAGCAMPRQPSVCDRITDPSLLCDMAAHYNVRLEDIGAVLVAVNAVAIGEGAYMRKDARNVLSELLLMLDEGAVSYVMFKAGIESRLKKYPGLLDVSRGYLEYFTGRHAFIYKRDREILRRWLARQIERL